MNKSVVSIQGYLGSWHDIARQKYFGNHHELLSRDTFKEVFADLAEGRADYAVVSIENSLFGSINEVYDLLLKAKFWISGEINLRIHHCLVGLKGTKLDQISEVHSHPVALAQCEDYLDKVLWHAERFENHDTAGSAADVARWQNPHKAAVASGEAARLHKLTVLAREIEDNKQNYTRFIVLQKHRPATNNTTKTSVVMRTDHKPGALYRALGAFAENNINLSKLESRPIIGKAWHYMFYVDFEKGVNEKSVQTAFKHLNGMGCELTILGSYQKGRVIS